MLRRQALYKALDPAMLSSGLQPDLQDLKKALWAEAENVRFYGGKVVRNLPPLLAFQLEALPIRGLSQQRSLAGTRWLWAAAGPHVSRWFGPARELIWSAPSWQQDETSVSPASFWDFVHWGDWTVMNDGRGDVKIYKPGSGVSTLLDAPTNVLQMAKKYNFLLAIGYGERGTRVGWSSADDIEDWTATAENEAGSLSVDDLDTRITAANRLGQHISVYGEDQLALVTFTNAPFYFGQRTVLDGIGAIGKKAVASDGSSNFGVGRNGCWWTDSNTYRYVDEYLHDYLQEEVNWEQGSKIVVARNDITGCIDFHFPMRGSLVCNEGWSLDPRTGGWSKVPAQQMQDERKLFPSVIGGGGAGEVRFLQRTPTLAAPLLLVSKPLTLQLESDHGIESVHTDLHVDEAELLCKQVSNVRFRVESAQDLQGPWDHTEWQTVQSGGNTYHLGHVPSGVYWRLRFESTADNWQLNLQGFMLFGQVEGTKRRGIS